MKIKRSDLSRVIKVIQQNQTRLDELEVSIANSVVAELLNQNNKLIEAKRNFNNTLDFVGKFKDPFNEIKSVAVELKNVQRRLEVSALEEFSRSIKAAGIDRGYFVSTNAVSEAARHFAEVNKAHISLMDRSDLARLANQYTYNLDKVSSDLFKAVKNLDLNRLAYFSDPTLEQIEELNIEEYDVDENQKQSIVAVNYLPFRLISKIMRAPDEIKNLSPRQFEEFVAETLAQLGFSDVILTPRSRDGGKDVIASHEVNGIPLSFYFECKKYADDNKIQLETLRALLGTLSHDATQVNKGVLVTTSTFTKGSQEFILAESRLDGKDYDGILGWINELNKKM